jgi:ABC-type amino acid transport system permease subunit
MLSCILKTFCKHFFGIIVWTANCDLVDCMNMILQLYADISVSLPLLLLLLLLLLTQPLYEDGDAIIC